MNLGMLATFIALAEMLSAQPAPVFEVATVKVSPAPGNTTQRILPGGEYILRNWSLRLLVMRAYNVRPDEVLGGPRWLDSDRFDIVGKAAPGTSPEQLKIMLRSLLQDRFGLVVHSDERVLPAYILTVSPKGIKMAISIGEKPVGPACGPGDGPPDRKHIVCRHASVADLASMLSVEASGYIDRAIVDKTELKGLYDVKLDWSRIKQIEGPDSVGGVTVFGALESQAGLRLEPRKVPLTVLVIDEAKQPEADR